MAAAQRRAVALERGGDGEEGGKEGESDKEADIRHASDCQIRIFLKRQGIPEIPHPSSAPRDSLEAPGVLTKRVSFYRREFLYSVSLRSVDVRDGVLVDLRSQLCASTPDAASRLRRPADEVG